MTIAKCRERVRAAGTTSGTAEKEQPHRHAWQPHISQVTSATEQRGRGALPVLWVMGDRALEDMLRLQRHCPSAPHTQHTSSRDAQRDAAHQMTCAATEGIAQPKW